MIFVWDAITAERLEFMTLPRGSRSVSALAFNPDSTIVAAGDMTDDYKIHLFDLTAPKVKGKTLLVCTAKLDSKKI